MSTTPLSDDELRASPVATTGPLTYDQLVAFFAANVIGIQLRSCLDDAFPLRVDGTGTVQNVQAETWPLPEGAAEQATLQALLDKTPALGPRSAAESAAVTVAVDGEPVPTVVTGVAVTKEIRKQTSTTARVAAESTRSVLLLAANPDRLGGLIYNDSSAALYICTSRPASPDNFTLKLLQDDCLDIEDWSGDVFGIWASTTGAARVTEFT